MNISEYSQDKELISLTNKDISMNLLEYSEDK